MARPVETLTVRLPYCARAAALSFVLALLVLRPALLSSRAGGAVLAVIGVGFVILAVHEAWHIHKAGVGVDLDGSRRWVYLTRVSDAFAGAATASSGTASASGPEPRLPTLAGTAAWRGWRSR